MADGQVEPERGVARYVSWRVWLALACILLVGLALRVLYFRELVNQPDFTVPSVDAQFHDYWARALVTGDWTPPRGGGDPQIRETPFLRPPGYPYFLSLIYRLTEFSYAAPRVAQIGLGLLSCVLGFLFARRWYGSGVGLIWAALMSTYWVLIYFEGELHAPALLIVLLLAVAFVAAGLTERFSIGRGGAAGVLLGLAALVRPNVLLLVPAIVFWVAWIAYRRRSARGWLGVVAGLLLGTVIAIAPVTIRNYRVSGDFIPITANVGINLFIGNNPTADGGIVQQIPGLGKFGNCFDYPALVENLEQKQGRSLTAAQVSRYFTTEALRWIWENPLDFLLLTARKTIMFWGPREIAHNKVIRCERDNSGVLAALPANFWFVLGTGLAGVFLLVRDLRRDGDGQSSEMALLQRRWEVLVLVGLLVITFFLSILPFFIAARYRIPIVPFLLLFAAYGLYRTGQLALLRSQRGIALFFVVWIVLSAWAGRPTPLSKAERAKWHTDRGQAHFRLKQIEPAMSELTQALQLDPSNTRTRLGMGLMLAKQGRLDEAAAQYREILRIDSQHKVARRALAKVQKRAAQLRGNDP